jgi:Tfp pilus assembly protein PilO
VLLVVGALVVVQPQLAVAGALDEQRTALEQQSAATRDRIAHLQEQGEDLPALSDELDELRAAIPATLDSSAYIQALGRLADSTGVSITSITVGDGQAYAAPPAPADGSAAEPGIVTDPRITAENFVVIPVSLSVAGSWDQVLRFLDGL